jgi:PAS domain S-box-containing protein
MQGDNSNSEAGNDKIAPTQLDFRRLFESVPGLYLVLAPDLTIVGASNSYLTATLTSRDAVLGRGIFDVFPDNPSDVTATGVGNLRRSLERVLLLRKPDSMAVQKYDIRDSNGEFEERFWSPVNTPVLGPSGTVDYIIHRVDDVTDFIRADQQKAAQEQFAQRLLSRGEEMEAEIIRRAKQIQETNQQLRIANEELSQLRDQLEQRVEQRTQQLAEANLALQAENWERRRTEETLVASEDRLRLMIENSRDFAIFMLDPGGNIVTWNIGAERMTGYTATEIVGRNYAVFFPDEEIAAGVPLRELEQSAADGRYESDGWRVRKDRSRFWLNGLLTPLYSNDGQIRGFAKIMRDISQRKQLEAQLRQSQKLEAFGQLAGGVAHDFNNLLTIISGYTELIHSQLDEDDPKSLLLNEVGQAVNRAAALTRQLLAFTRQQVLEPRILNLNEIVAEVEKLLQRLIGEDIVLTAVLAPDLDPVKVDPGQIEQVIMNLAVNARDSMPQGGRLTIETSNVELDDSYVRAHPESQAGRFVLLAATDTGCGMTPEVRSRIFEPFFTTKAIGEGTGLGLSVAQGIIRQSGGMIEVYSEVGTGTTFKIYLPAVNERLDNRPHIDSRSPTVGNETILLVEDEDNLRELAALALITCGYSVLKANCGTDALRVKEAHAGHIDLLVTDVIMPELSGGKLAEILVARDPNLKVLYLSGYTDDAVVRHGILHNDVAFLQKPFTPKSLARKVREVLDAK